MKKISAWFAFLFFISSYQALASSNRQGSSNCQKSHFILDKIECPSQSLQVEGRFFSRTVKYALPQGTPPDGGWPAVMIYQGSFLPVEFWRYEDTPFGGYNEIRLIQNLLDHGFAVIAPRALSKLAWLTNIIGIDYDSSDDKTFIANILKGLDEGHFGPINTAALFATGISSGGYNASRMAVSFPGVFKALAIESASYASCGGPLCRVPGRLPADHPPTLFLHGDWDFIVPIQTMWLYHDELEKEHIDTEVFVENKAGHQWLEAAPDLITAWFLRYL